MNGVALVTGGSRGIGYGITTALLREGYSVAIMATRPPDPSLIEQLTKLGDVLYHQGDVANLDDHDAFIQAAIDRWKRIDLLVNNAGVAPTTRMDILSATPESYDRVMNINLRGPYFLTQRVAAAMIARRPGSWSIKDGPIGTIINVSSISAEVVSTDRGEYCLSKAGIAMATQLWASRLAREGILAYELRPGIVATDMTAGVKAKYDAYFESGAVPIARWGQPEDVGATVVALCKYAMPYSTGDVIHVDGGMHIAEL